jgi:signal transduction histidine kinase/DNA-binding response OmpR family regulator
VPVILLSARAGEEARVEGVKAGADDYLSKPFSARELVAHVSAHLQMARVRREANQALRDSERQLLAELSAMARMQQVSTRLVQAGDFSTLLHDILDAAIEITGADMGNIQLLEDGVLKIVAQRGFQKPFLDFFNAVHEGHAACGTAMDKGERVIVEDVANSDIFTGTPALDVVLAAGALAVQSTPLVSRFGRVLGMFSTHYNEPHRPSEHVLHQLDVLARQAADLIERKQAEEEREELLAAERVAREAADAASRAKDEFLATVSHELRNPLNAMLGWARVLSGGTLNEETMARGLKAIEQNAKAQAQLIEDLLDVSRIISGKFRLKVEPIRVVRVIEAAIDSMRPAAEAKGVRLQATLDPDAEPVSGDAGRLQQVVWNLLSNAVKFTPKGGCVQVRLTRINSHIEIEVSDTGQGIAPEFLPYVFDRFRQADGSTTRRHGGLGLGLAIVRHIAELHGGSVTADSPGKDQGATFTVRLPLMVIHKKYSDEERVHPKVDGDIALHFNPSSCLQGVRVLVVDDEPDALQLLSTVLTQCGAHVRTASSAEEGFAAVKEWRPNVIVSDVGMPEEDGYSFMKQVRTWCREAGAWMPAVALTAYARAEDRMKALDSGYQMHVPKPVEPLELIKVLESLVERPTTPWKYAL